MKNLTLLSIIFSTFSLFSYQDNNYVYNGLKNVNAKIGIKENSNFKPNSCLSILNNDPNSTSGYYDITINNTTYNLYCDMENFGGGWTLFAVGIGGSNQSGWLTTKEGNSSELGRIDSNNSWKLSDNLINNFNAQVYRFEHSNYNRFFKGHTYVHNRSGASLEEANVSYEDPNLTTNLTYRSNAYTNHRQGLSDDIFNSYDGRNGEYWHIWAEGASMNNSYFNGYDYTNKISFCEGSYNGCNIYLYLK